MKHKLIIPAVSGVAALVLVAVYIAWPEQPEPETTQIAPDAAEEAVYVMPGTDEQAYGPGIIADRIREGEIDVGDIYDMEPGNRFHRIHARYMAIGCVTCHSGVEFPEPGKILRHEDYPLAAYPGEADRTVCLGCHRGGGSFATQLYGVAPK